MSVVRALVLVQAAKVESFIAGVPAGVLDPSRRELRAAAMNLLTLYRVAHHRDSMDGILARVVELQFLLKDVL